MELNELSPNQGSRATRKRVGRGIGSGLGKTCGRGHKGQKSRSGGFHKLGFEGGQMPIQRRLPKFGFKSRKSLTATSVRLSTIAVMNDGTITLDTLKSNGIIQSHITDVKIYLSGEIKRAVTIKGLKVTKGALAAIEAAGGKTEQ